MTEIKPYTAPYRKAVTDLITTIQKEFGISITLGDQPDLNNIADFYQSDEGNFWIALVDGEVIGTTALLNIGNGQAALRKMFVRKDYRGKEFSIGKNLLDTLLHWARQKNFTEIYLGTTEKFLAAHRFYEKNGFTEIRKENLPARFPVMAVDIKFYVFSLTD